MKNEKFCFSKGTGLIALVGVLLVGFVLVNQMVTDTKTSTDSRAEKAKSVASGGGTAVAPQGTIVLSELILKTDKAVTAIAAVISGCAVQTNGAGCAGASDKQTTLINAKKAVNAAFSKLTGTQNPDSKDPPSEGTFLRQSQNVTAYLKGVESSKKTSIINLTNAEKAVTSAKTNWDNAIQDTKDAQKKVDNQTQLYQGSFSKFNTSLDTFIRILKTLPVAITVQSTTKELEKLKLDNFNTSNTDLKIFAGFDKFVQFDTKISAPDLATGKSTVDTYESWLTNNDKKSFRSAYTSFHATLTAVASDKKTLDSYKSTLATATSTEATKKAVYDTAVITQAKAANIDAVYGELVANITVADQALKALQIKSDTVLPAGPAMLSGLVVPNTNGADISAYASVQSALDVVNQALVDTNAAYKTLDDAATASNVETVNQASAYNDYCKSIKPYKKAGVMIQTFFPVIDPSLTVVGADGIPVGLASDVARFYKETQCDKNASNYVWNGSWGNAAKCYTATGVCSTQQGCRTTDCIANIGSGTNCIYREVPVENCDPDLLANKSLTCMSSGQYFKVGSDYYETNGLREKNGKKYCGSKKIESTDATAIQAATNYITTTLTNKDQAKDRECKLSSKFGWDNNRKGFAIAYQDLLGQTASGSYTPSMVCYHMSARSNGTGDRCLNEMATDASGAYSDKVCNCQKEIETLARDGDKTNDTVSIQLVDGIYQCVGSKYFSP